jgi:hypothetical protein
LWFHRNKKEEAHSSFQRIDKTHKIKRKEEGLKARFFMFKMEPFRAQRPENSN